MAKKQNKQTEVYKDFSVNISKKGVGVKVERIGEEIWFETENLHLIKNIDDMYEFLESVENICKLTSKNKINYTIDECCKCECCE